MTFYLTAVAGNIEQKRNVNRIVQKQLMVSFHLWSKLFKIMKKQKHRPIYFLSL